ncbi:MAG: response regulator [Leptolyngbya sp.]|nr:response regulator [Candidatus Melainabacteria bacterium]
MFRDEIEKLQIKAMKSNSALVLVIEDNPSQQRFFSLIEENVGMVCCVVDSCSTALELLKYVRFNLIMLDLQMPSVEAIHCAREIRLLEFESGFKTPIIAVTANAMPGDREKCLDAGADDYLPKPFPLVQLKKMIAQWAA